MSFFVYILLCNDGSFYTGYTQNLKRRVRLHKNCKGAKYTKSHKPKNVAFVELFESRSEALKRERRIKKMSHKQKQKLIIKNNYSSD
ncbi:MAG: GIY-YIG nuclease family protein [Candidatus Bathyarchaeota archaeon]|nr:GIY-YIG nuclease family protein [Candidatus Bathyarchaeota archaeon]